LIGINEAAAECRAYGWPEVGKVSGEQHINVLLFSLDVAEGEKMGSPAGEG